MYCRLSAGIQNTLCFPPHQGRNFWSLVSVPCPSHLHWLSTFRKQTPTTRDGIVKNAKVLTALRNCEQWSVLHFIFLYENTIQMYLNTPWMNWRTWALFYSRCICKYYCVCPVHSVVSQRCLLVSQDCTPRKILDSLFLETIIGWKVISTEHRSTDRSVFHCHCKSFWTDGCKHITQLILFILWVTALSICHFQMDDGIPWGNSSLITIRICRCTYNCNYWFMCESDEVNMNKH